MKTTINLTLDLPAPPQWMLDEVQQEQDAYEVDLFDRCMTIKEFRILLIPIIWKKKAELQNHVSLLLLPVWHVSAERQMKEARNQKRIGLHRYLPGGLDRVNQRRAWNDLPPVATLEEVYGPDILEMTHDEIAQYDATESTNHSWHKSYANKVMEIVFNINKYGAEKFQRDWRGSHYKSSTWGKMMLPKVEAALAFKNGKVPETRKTKAYELCHHYKREHMRPFWECVAILKKNIKMEMITYDSVGVPYLNELFKN